MLNQMKHAEFEQRASQMKDATRFIETTPSGVSQHVVRTSAAILRWPVAYEPERPAPTVKVRYMSVQEGLSAKTKAFASYPLKPPVISGTLVVAV